MIYKLKYTDKEAALLDFKNKGIYNNNLSFGLGIEAIVEIGTITFKAGIYSDEGVEIEEPIYLEGYHYDIMSNYVINFNDNEMIVNNPAHNFYI